MGVACRIGESSSASGAGLQKRPLFQMSNKELKFRIIPCQIMNDVRKCE